MRGAVYQIPVLLAILLVLGGAAVFSGCYTLKQGFTLIGYLRRAIPLEALADMPGSAAGADTGDREKNRRFVERIQGIRRFAQEKLGLRETKNYTRYTALDRNYLAAVVSASPKDSFAPYEWRFPVVGKVPYKGFFDPRDAKREAEKLAKQDLDVWVRGVDAFSTLGWFQDPLYSYMRDYPVYQLAELLIHELCHATIYLKNHAQFNEELAEFIGREGARLYMEQTFGRDAPEYQAMAGAGLDAKAYVDFLQELIKELDALYQSGTPREELLEQKALRISAAQSRFEAEYAERFQGGQYRSFSTLPVNNAYLSLFRLYYGEGNFFEDLYTRSGGDLARFINAAKSLSPRGDPKAQLAAALAPQP
jgi:predicted aminopeptidase